MTPDSIKISDYEITEEQLANLATEFFGSIAFPAGNHQIAHVAFSPQPDLKPAVLRELFLHALSCYKVS